MYNEIINYIKNKNIAILGFGREGKSTYKFIRKHLKDKMLTVLDQNKNAISDIDDDHLTLISDNYLDYIDKYDLVIKTPGISLIGKNYNAEITSEVDLLTRFVPVQLIGITGTKGKSTTSSLIYTVVSDQLKNTFYVGNIGIPIFDYIEKFTPDSIVVAELSAHQLNDIKNSPHIAIILNLFEEHLDYFHTLDNYYNAKLNIFRYQKKTDYALYYSDNDELTNRVKKINSLAKMIPLNKKMILNDEIKIGDYTYFFNKGQYLIGDYNKIDIMFSLYVAKILNLNLKRCEEVIRNFKPLEHRMELINGGSIKFYDDTLATIPEATLNSIKAIKDLETLIVGGKDRNIDYTNFVHELANTSVKNIICQPDTGKYIYENLKNSNKNVYYVEELEDAVILAYKITSKDKSCLLSPAASSYNKYQNYADKSAHFKMYIEKYKQ